MSFDSIIHFSGKIIYIKVLAYNVLITGFPVLTYQKPFMIWLLSISFYHPKVNNKSAFKSDKIQ